MANRTTATQKYNARMESIFENAKISKRKYAPLHVVQMLTQMTEKVEEMNRDGDSSGVNVKTIVK